MKFKAVTSLFLSLVILLTLSVPLFAGSQGSGRVPEHLIAANREWQSLVVEIMFEKLAESGIDVSRHFGGGAEPDAEVLGTVRGILSDAIRTADANLGTRYPAARRTGGEHEHIYAIHRERQALINETVFGMLAESGMDLSRLFNGDAEPEPDASQVTCCEQILLYNAAQYIQHVKSGGICTEIETGTYTGCRSCGALNSVTYVYSPGCGANCKA